MTFEEFWAELWSPEESCVCALCADRKALCRNLHAYLLATGADPAAVLSGTAKTPAAKPDLTPLRELAKQWKHGRYNGTTECVTSIARERELTAALDALEANRG